MAVPGTQRAKIAHVNMMTDTVITNLNTDGLRVVLRALLASCPNITETFEAVTRDYLQASTLPPISPSDIKEVDIGKLQATQRTIRCMVGCGLCLQSLALIGDVVVQAANLSAGSSEISSVQAAIDGDVVQALTAVQKTLFTSTGMRSLSEKETAIVNRLYRKLTDCQYASQKDEKEFPFSRALFATASLLKVDLSNNASKDFIDISNKASKPPPGAKETFELAGRKLPRIFSGLWQLSSPAWGSASTGKIISQFSNCVQTGFTAFDMADHYGDAEIIFGQFLQSYAHKNAIFAATKYCVFQPITISKEVVRANVSERCQRLQTDKIDLLQFHWQFYDDPHYIDALHHLLEDDRVGSIGLCNFDTEHLQLVLDSGVTIHTNQVQFSLIDSRPVMKMGKVCEKHNIKLLTYGTLCGGFLAEKWIGKDEPDLYDETTTPSQRKYHAMIRCWGDWSLFQELLQTLKNIGDKHSVQVSNVATRWVLDFSYVGAVIVGNRMGISQHTDENLASFGWRLDDDDQASIETVLKRSRRGEMFKSMGDCGGEYR